MLRIVSYNIHSGRDLFWRKRLNEMAETLRDLNADIIGLQEVHQNSRYGYQAKHLADLLDYQYAYAPAAPVADGAYGNALLTRIPLIKASMQPLPAKKEPRSLLQATLLWQNQEIEAWVTHCSLDYRSRHSQLALIRNLAQEIAAPLILLGDFNTQDSALCPLLKDCAKEKERHALPTLTPLYKRVDFIFASGCWHVEDYQVINVKWSDHFPLLSILRLNRQPVPAE
jgi:endonuclease/exonuclease/phosphatase family metal-dependent hydrolase